MSNAKRTGAGHKLRYTAYKQQNRIATNRRKRLERALKKTPANEQIKTALSAGLGQRRKTPKDPIWSHNTVRLAKLLKQVQGNFNMDILSRNEKLHGPAIMDAGNLGKLVAAERAQPKRVKGYDFGAMFSLGARI